ncbi:hypothetical protein [Streptomyces sp. NPDC048644]|uniref:hypothetical protein n=1 Tax=Streptomyces sp. NPDC048644 TaxID=3365582 RepID=UPI003717BCD9
MVTGRTTHSGLAVLTALAVVTIMPGAVGVASADGLPAYRTADGATPLRGTASAADAQEFGKGPHTDTLKRGEQKYYVVTLDARTNAYFSVVAAPPHGTKVEDHRDKLTLSVQDSSGTTCDRDADAAFHGGGAPYPIGDYATRRIGGDRTNCQSAGPYYLVVGREGSATSGPDTWPIELTRIAEPALKGSTPAKPAEGSRPTETPAPPTTGSKRKARGGTGFNDAGSIGQGLWKDRIRPGETRFYRVPVDWGQRLNLSAELPNSTATASAHVSDAFGLTVYNPARGTVDDDAFVPYDGKPAAAKMFTAPVDYGNRFDYSDAVQAMRFAGWYYLEVTLHPDTTQFFPQGADLTLRVDVRGKAHAGPGYAEPTRDFTVTPDDRETADKGLTAQEATDGGSLRTLGYAGLGAGVVLLAGLAAWTLVARRRGAAAVPAAPPPFPQQVSPSQPTEPAQRPVPPAPPSQEDLPPQQFGQPGDR